METDKDDEERNSLDVDKVEFQEGQKGNQSENKANDEAKAKRGDLRSEVSEKGQTMDHQNGGDVTGSDDPQMTEQVDEREKITNKGEDDEVSGEELSGGADQEQKMQTSQQDCSETSRCDKSVRNRSRSKIKRPNDRNDKLTTGADKGSSKQTQAIIVDVSIPRVTHTPQTREGRAGGSAWSEGTGNNGSRQGGGVCKSVDFSVPVGMDEVDAELARVVGVMAEEQSLFDPHEYGRGATTNTPVTVMTDYAESQIQGQGITTPSRENIYQHALSIMKKRCQSSRTVMSNAHSSYYRPRTPEKVIEENGATFPNFSLPTVVANMDKPPMVQTSNCVFYVTQSRQHPIAPVKTWKGYEGNLYFQPMVCKKADLTPSTTPRENALNKATRRAYSTPILQGKTGDNQMTHLPQLPKAEGSAGDDATRSAPSVVGSRSVYSQSATAPKLSSRNNGTAKSQTSTARQMALLDKQAVLGRMDSNIREDIRWISGSEAMGTLHLGELRLMPRSTAHFYDNAGKHHRLRIQRGLVSHRLAAHNQSLPTLLGVHGGRLNDGADGVAKTEHLQSQYHASNVSQSSDDYDRHLCSPNLYGGYSGPFSSIEQLRRDSASSHRRADSSLSPDMILKDDSLHSLASVYKNPRNVPLYSSKEVLFRNREALFLTRPTYR
ncbi:uncharacterized protein LOC110975883 [Acanthaster planci]|uniref:Uncharacterized protein LOC110975883 n=1 Tax=Acanthaster planci TaxID=133434 RepID=A0A8B7XUA8_ACAPL|nr:uncharacterized protein LOC110975883 [Acanthaster planci]